MYKNRGEGTHVIATTFARETQNFASLLGIRHHCFKIKQAALGYLKASSHRVCWYCFYEK